MNLDVVPFLQARNWTWGRPVAPNLIVVHSTEGGSSARGVAEYFAGPGAPQASTHYTCDDTSTWCSVRPSDQAWATGHGRTNARSISIEQLGYAAWTTDEWRAHEKMLAGQVAPLIAALAERYSIPLVWLDAGQVRAGSAGVCSHRTVTDAWHVSGGHTDPGDGWPHTLVLDAARGSIPQESDMITSAVNADGRLEVFWSRPTGQVQHRWQTQPGAAPWSGWQPLGRPVPGADGITAALNPRSGRIEVVVSAGDQVVHAWQSPDLPSGWSDWTSEF